MKYELYDIYECDIYDQNAAADLICTSDDRAEIMQAAEEYEKDTDGECKMFIREWI